MPTFPLRPARKSPVSFVQTREKIARRIDLHLAVRNLDTSQRIVRAQDLEDSIRDDLQPLYNFLRAARRNESRFPDPARSLLESLACVRKALDDIEEMVKGNADFEVTEPDSDDQGDTTLVANRSSESKVEDLD
ncbi:hypothetical protein B0H10DRAFT_1958032 [Mycena sp. CBHHK59/15]|nr:hypothetical protein B0H10DRAFT_1958032 [Mycena sp. CBHHK59/15]